MPNTPVPALPELVPAPVNEAVRLEQFATLYAMGVPIPKALKEAGYTTSSLSHGYRLLHHPDVIAKVDEVRGWRNERLRLSISDVVAMLERDHDFAHEMSNPAAAIQATSMIGKILGALEPGAKTPTKITIEWGEEGAETSTE